MNSFDYDRLADLLRRRLQQPLPGAAAHERMFPGIKEMPRVVPDDAMPSAVMVLLFEKNEEWRLLAIHRTEDGRAHSGQVSFPGGRYELTDDNLQVTALRETYEEVGILSDNIDILGALSPVYIVVSNFMVYPFVGLLKETASYSLSVNEVKQVLEVSLKELFAGEALIQTDVTSPAVPGVIRKVNAFRLPDGTIIWGATAMMIAELQMVLADYNEA
jgi:8-oxo-dGTP pyrophosphatase MutT (NUDIX family)